MRKQKSVLSEEVRARSEEVSPLFPPRSSLFPPRSSLLALPSSLLALTSSLLALSLLASDGLPLDGGQWIETGCCPAAGDRFECDVTVDAVQPNASAALFGTVREGEPERTFAFYVRQDGDDSTVVAYGDMARGGFFPRGKRVTLSVGPDGAKWEWEGGFGRIELTPGFARDGVTPLLIGDANAARFVGDSVPAGTGAAMTLHRFRIWRGGLELIHDYEPRIDPNGRYGVYDTVKGRFLPCVREIGFAVNGKDVGRGEGPGWSYMDGVVSLTNAMEYVLSGVATNNEVQVRADAAGATVVLSNVAVFASEAPAFVKVQGASLTVAAGQMLKTGQTLEALRYVQAYNGERCVLAAPGVTVTVKDIPHVTGFTVSNAVEVITNAAHAATCRVMAGDDVFVGYTVEADCFSKSPNPLAYPAITGNITVDADSIPVLPYLPYRAWNGATWRMVDCVCSNYTVVATNTATFADGQWYAVTGTVSCGTITVSGSAHLILCDDAKLTAEGGEKQAGVKVEEGRSLAIYGQKLGTGELVTRGGRLGAGIGGSYDRDCGMVTIHGGTVTADGGNESAGIGGGDFGAGGTVTVNGGTVTATGGFDGPGIGGGYQANGSGRVAVNGGRVTATGGRYGAGIGGGNLTGGGEVTVNGGTVTANGGEEAQDIGQGRYAGDGNWTLVFDGGSVRAARLAKGLAKNSTPTNVYCVTAKVEGLRVEKLRVEGLGSYGTNDIYAVKNEEGVDCVYLWLPDGTHRFMVSDGTTTNRYRAIVKGEGITVEPLPTYGFHVNGTDVGDGFDTGWSYANGVLSLTNAMTYVLSGVATNNEVQVRADAAGATVVLSNVAVFASGAPAFVKVQGASLSVAANQVLKTGDTPEALRYAQAYNGERCVRAAPGVTVTVKDIPHVTGFTVSNAVETITNAARAATCRVMAGDDVFVGYTVEADCFSKSPNPLAYPAITSDITVDADSLPVLPYLPYRAWNAATWQMVDCVCSNYTVVATNTATFADGQWYAVTGTVSCGTITVSGSAHLILCDGAKMTADAITNGTLAVYGQPSGCGALEVSGTVATALTVQGGRISAKALAVGSLAVVGGTLAADAVRNDTVMIAGGSVKAQTIENAPSNGIERVFCVTVKLSEEGRAGSEEGRAKRLAVEGLGGYGTNDIYAIDSRVYLWLPDGTHRFAVSDGATTNRYCAVVHGRGVTVEPLGPIGFFVNGEDVGDTGSGTGWNYNKNMKNLTLSEVGLYVLSGVAMNDEVHIHVAGEKAAGATVILSNAVVFVSGQPPALNVDQNISLLMAGGSSFLGATNNVMAISVGPKAALTVGLAPGADETEAIIGVFNYGDVAAIGGAGSVTVRGGTLAVWADKRAAETPINRTADVFCMLAGNDPETAKVVDTYNGEPYVLVTAAIAPVTPGKPFGSFTTAEAATNVMKKAVLAPRDDVEAALGSGAARQTYCNMFGFAVTGGDESWFVEAVLTPEARTNLAETATGATRQIPVADIAALATDGKKDVSVTNCVPGFYYTLYGAATLPERVGLVETALPETGTAYGPELSGVSGEVTFPQVKKPSDAAGFFTIGVSATKVE